MHKVRTQKRFASWCPFLVSSFYEDIGNIIEKLPFFTLEQAELIISINDDNAILHVRMRYHI